MPQKTWNKEEILDIISEVQYKLMEDIEGDDQYTGVAHYVELLSNEFEK